MADELVAYAFANHGRWKAACPRPYCTNAEHYGADPQSGYIGGLTRTSFSCVTCRLAVPAVWPPHRREIDRLLMRRPAPATRNWLPGETLQQLFMENLDHGIAELPAIEDVPDGKVFQIVGNEVELGPAAVAAGMTRREIGAG